MVLRQNSYLLRNEFECKTVFECFCVEISLVIFSGWDYNQSTYYLFQNVNASYLFQNAKATNIKWDRFNTRLIVSWVLRTRNQIEIFFGVKTSCMLDIFMENLSKNVFFLYTVVWELKVRFHSGLFKYPWFVVSECFAKWY